MVVLGAGCGGSDNSKTTTTPTASPVTTPRTIDAAEKATQHAAKKEALKAKDRHLPGPIAIRTICAEPVPPPAPRTPYQLRCHVEAYGTPPHADTLLYMTSEDWNVPVDPQGNVGKATLLGTGRVRAFRRLDDRLNCSGHVTRPEKCVKPSPTETPSDQAIPGQSQALPPGETVPNQPSNP
jgi:hypothetical protein